MIDDNKMFSQEVDDRLGSINNRPPDFGAFIENSSTSSDDFQQNELTNLFRDAFFKVKNSINPKYHNILDIGVQSYRIGSKVLFGGSQYTIHSIIDDKLLVMNHNSIKLLNKFDVEQIFEEMDNKTTTIVYKLIYDLIGDEFNELSFCVKFSSIFCIDIVKLLSMIPYDHAESIRIRLKNKFIKSSEQSPDTSLF